MMMSKPQTKEQTSPSTKQIAPAAGKTTATTASDPVADLERRLQLLGGDKQATTEETPKQEPETIIPQQQAAPVKGGKNALLARIMAAQEKAKQASHAQKPPAAAAVQPPDLLSEPNVEEKKDEPPPPLFDQAFAPPPPPIESVTSPPPPSFDFLEQQQQKQLEPPPPSFDAIEHQVKPPAPPAPPAPEPTMAALPAMSAPSYEDLLDHGPPQSTTLEGIEPLQAPEIAADDDDILNIPGLSPEERQALMDEQRRIMEQIEQERAANEKAIAAARAESFDQRSNTSVARAADGGSTASSGGTTRTVYLGDGQEVALHGQERTKAAIAAGTAILVQCIHCQNWMQVTDTATLMYCPVCSVVSPVEKQTAVLTQEEARQVSADRRLAEQLQSEEYDDGEEEEEAEETWWDSITGIFGGSKKAKPAVGVPAPHVRPPARGEVGVTRPPGSPPRSGLMPARTGEEQPTETITFSRSHDEQEGLLSGSGSRGLQPARVAEQKPLFSCMVDSVSTAASSLGTALTAQTLSEDKEGNVHGVDASSLLAVSQVSRSDTEYTPLRDNEGS